jgi:predicted nucleic-acid-binding Zn-ribbon protein
MSTLQAEASKPLKKMQECNKCRNAGFPEQMISFEKTGEDAYSGKVMWRLLDEDGQTHIHKIRPNAENSNSFPKRKRIADISTVTDIEEAKKLIRSGWEYKTVFPATLANIPHYVLVKRE